MGAALGKCSRSFSLATALGICLTATISSGTSLAQQKTQRGKHAAPTRRANTRRPPALAEPDIQLEQLPADPAVDNADISITAHVRARSLRFETVPNPTVEFPGSPARDTVWEAQRENLPTPVQPGVTYRNIGIQLKITSVFRDIDRIVAEALGEVPVNVDKIEPQPATKPVTTSKAASPDLQPASTPPPSGGRP
jgi:hypothetical protein